MAWSWCDCDVADVATICMGYLFVAITECQPCWALCLHYQKFGEAEDSTNSRSIILTSFCLVQVNKQAKLVVLYRHLVTELSISPRYNQSAVNLSVCTTSISSTRWCPRLSSSTILDCRLMFPWPCLKTEFHLHSTILKLHSWFFLTYLDSADKDPDTVGSSKTLKVRRDNSYWTQHLAKPTVAIPTELLPC